jgi:Lon protease-like protein
VAPIPPQPGAGTRLPLFPLSTVLVPGMPLALHVFEPRYRQLLTDLLTGPRNGAPEFGVVALRSGWEVGAPGELHQVGTTARITDLLPHPDGRCDLSAVGERRFLIESVSARQAPYLVGRVRYLDEPAGNACTGQALAVRSWLDVYAATLAAIGVAFPGDGGVGRPRPRIEHTDLAGMPGMQALSYVVAGLPSLPVADRQSLLAEPDTGRRLCAARTVLRRETELLRALQAVPAAPGEFAALLGAN